MQAIRNLRVLGFLGVLGAFAVVSGLMGCGTRQVRPEPSRQLEYFQKIDFASLQSSPSLTFIRGLAGYQQTTEYTCGPAAAIALAHYYQIPGIGLDAATELAIAREMGTRGEEAVARGEKPGTRPEELRRWLETHGFTVTLEFEDKGDYSGLRRIRENLARGIPSLVEWIDWSGHWVIAVGYDTRGTAAQTDDVLIFADSYDRVDGRLDGYTWVSAERFYWMWFDALYFDRLTWRTLFTAVPDAGSDAGRK